MPRLLTPLGTLPLYAVVKPTLAATAILQPQTTIITQQLPPVPLTTPSQISVTSTSTKTSTPISTIIQSSKQKPESGTTRTIFCDAVDVVLGFLVYFEKALLKQFFIMMKS